MTAAAQAIVVAPATTAAINPFSDLPNRVQVAIANTRREPAVVTRWLAIQLAVVISLGNKRHARCSVCHRTVFSGKRGRAREVHKECEPLRDALKALAYNLTPERLAALHMTAEALVELRYEILLLSTEIPRPRIKGRFIRRRG